MKVPMLKDTLAKISIGVVGVILPNSHQLLNLNAQSQYIGHALAKCKTLLLCTLEPSNIF